MDIGTSIRSAGIRGLRVPRGVVSVEVAQDDGVILDMEESGEGGGVARGAGGVRWDVDVVDVDGNGINGGSDG